MKLLCEHEIEYMKSERVRAKGIGDGYRYVEEAHMISITDWECSSDSFLCEPDEVNYTVANNQVYCWTFS